MSNIYIQVYNFDPVTKTMTPVPGKFLFDKETMDRACAELAARDAEYPRKAPIDSIYLIKNHSTGHVKIGRSTDVKARLRAMQHASSTLLELIYHFAVSDGKKAEKELHKRFAGKRLRGEWFALTERDIRSIRKRPQQIALVPDVKNE